MKTLVLAIVVGAAFGLLPTDAEADGFPVHGNWCGPGHGGGEPVDPLDEACKRHDECYADSGYFDCKCDTQLIDDIDELPAGGGPPQKAALIREWFTEEQRCWVKVKGIPGPVAGPVLGLLPPVVQPALNGSVLVPPVVQPILDGPDPKDIGPILGSAIPVTKPVVKGKLDPEDIIENAIPGASTVRRLIKLLPW